MSKHALCTSIFLFLIVDAHISNCSSFFCRWRSYFSTKSLVIDAHISQQKRISRWRPYFPSSWCSYSPPRRRTPAFIKRFICQLSDFFAKYSPFDIIIQSQRGLSLFFSEKRKTKTDSPKPSGIETFHQLWTISWHFTN